MKKGFIYGLRCPLSGEIKYIGQTIKSINRRLTEHKCDKRHNPYKINWINKLDKLGILDKLKIELLEECEKSLLNDREKFWIEKFKQEGNKLVNLTDGGDTNYIVNEDAIERTRQKLKGMFIGRKLSNETKEKISKTHKGKILTNEHKKSISNGLILAKKEGRKNDIVTEKQKYKISEGLKKYFLEHPKIKKEKIKKEKRKYTTEEKLEKSRKFSGEKNPFFGKKHNEESKKLISEKNKKNIGEKNPFFGKKHNEESRNKISNSLKEKPKKLYYIYNINNILIIKGTSIELLDFFNIKRVNNISRYCDKYKLYKGYYIKSN